SSASDVTLRASMADGVTGAWQVNPNAQRFPLAPFKNRTIALLVTPPAGATQGSRGDVNVAVEYARDPLQPNRTNITTLRLTADVVGPSALQLTTPITDATIGPSGTANYTMTVKNTGSIATPFRVSATPIPNWSVTASPEQGNLGPGETRTVVLVLIAPNDVTNDTRFASVVTVMENGNAANFDSAAFTVNILGGKALPRLSVPNLQKRVDRAGFQNFEVQVQNVGSASGRLTLEARSQDPAWLVHVQDVRGVNITGVQLNTNELANINVSVRAPFTVPEHTVIPIEVTAFSPDGTQAAKATLSAEVHDYGVQLTMVPSNKDALPGLPTEFTIRLRNTGNDNDTLNVSANLIDQPEWSVQLSSEEVRLEPGQEQEVRATIRSPTGPLPAPRAYTFPFWVGTRGGQAVNISKNMTQSAVVQIASYRAYDVDKDLQLEISVDLDKHPANGFEEFREVFNEGVATQVVAKGLFDGRTTFFLDVPKDRPYDGVADIWFNPETVYAFDITYAPDINGDGAPDYFVDADRDGKLDKAFDTATERFWDVVEVKVFGDDRIQYLVDTSGDGRPDRFFDPETGKVTRTQKADNVGADYVGIDVDDDDRVDYYYNTKTKETSGAEVSNVGSFARDYWWFFVVFAALVILTVVLIVRRRRAQP
ncbi:MAG TPA: hypothetical protein VM370_01290, partial [Candidatus Thermoplasmatota archaeon]|nr:hypothetical protein [Candidatus Thermoplasmatota archaeon]